MIGDMIVSLIIALAFVCTADWVDSSCATDDGFWQRTGGAIFALILLAGFGVLVVSAVVLAAQR